MLEKEKDWFTTKEAMEYLDRGQSSIYTYCKDSDVPLECHQEKPGGAIKITRESLKETALYLGVYHEDLIGNSEVPKAPEELRNLMYAKASIESLGLQPQHQEPLVNMINSFIDPLEKSWEEHISSKTDEDPKILDFTTTKENTTND